MFRFLSRLFVALAALFALRLLFATARRVNRGSGAPGTDPPRSEPSHAGARSAAAAKRAPRIDSSLAEEVPFVEVGAERERERVPRD